mmetsp:Transcript_31238/g.70670  ORF Transcript_31238/g.70670 Transcript_31238/m.70670 type:complete len:152 (-) Transcript_31238:906-1361(-)
MKLVAWASGIKILVVFCTDLHSMRRGLDGNGPFRDLFEKHRSSNAYPFVALADPDCSAASKFKLKSQSIVVQKRRHRKTDGLRDVMSRHRSLRGTLEIVLGGRRRANLLLSEFLVDEDGVLIDVLSEGQQSNDDMERIKCFMLTGKRLEDG